MFNEYLIEMQLVIVKRSHVRYRDYNRHYTNSFPGNNCIQPVAILLTNPVIAVCSTESETDWQLLPDPTTWWSQYAISFSTAREIPIRTTPDQRSFFVQHFSNKIYSFALFWVYSPHEDDHLPLLVKSKTLAPVTGCVFLFHSSLDPSPQSRKFEAIKALRFGRISNWSRGT